MRMFLGKDMSSMRKLMLLKAVAGNKAVEDTATGNPLTFLTDLARPLKSLLIPFTPVQSGSGDPSPQNIRSILPWNGLAVQQAGKNLFNKYIKPYRTGMYISEVRNNTVGYTGNENYNVYRIPVKSNTYYTFGLIKASTPMYAMLDEQGYVVYSGANEGGQTGTYKTVLTTGTTKFLLLSVAVNGTYKCDDVLQLEEGETHTEYEPITETAISFPSPVYGGTLDVVSGVLTAEYPTDEVSLDTLYFYMATDGNFVFMNLPFTFGDRAKIVCNSYKTVEFPYWSSMPDLSIMGSPSGDSIFRIRNDAFTDETTFRNHLTEIGAKIVYPLATPTEQTLTGHQITALVGDNTIWSDADGSLTAVYLKKG